MPRLVDLTGQRFGRLVVQRRGDCYSNGRGTRWVCLCDCGVSKQIFGEHIKRGLSTSCGCYLKEVAGDQNRTHGKAGKCSEYNIWCGIKARCLNPNDSHFVDYGGRGIKICDRWSDSFENFLADMGERPSIRYSIDRYPDNDGNYEPDNCRWATRREQNNNRRDNIVVSFNGEKMSLSDAVRAAGSVVSQHTAYMRFAQYGWSVDRAVSTVPQQRGAL